MIENRANRRPRATPVQAKQSLAKVPRIPRACDNYRLPETRCDVEIPCAFCTSHHFECIYDSKPKRRLDTKYIQSLEREIERLKLALEAAELKQRTSVVILNKFPIWRYSELMREQTPIQAPGLPATDGQTAPVEDARAFKDPKALLETMVDAAGSLDIDEGGNCDYRGNSAGLIMIRRIREHCDALLQSVNEAPTQLLKSPP